MPGASAQTTLVTGAAGFVGRRLLARLIQEAGVGTSLHTLDHKHHDVPAGVEGHVASVSQRFEVEQMMAEIRPSRIYHLAALADPRRCADEPELAMATNANGAANILRAALECRGHDTRVLVVSSSVVYDAPDHGPLNESASLRASGPYARSKRAAEDFASEYHRRGLPVIVARPFNHSGAGQTENFVLPALAAEIVRARREGRLPRTGNLHPRRDFLHVNDVVDAYFTLMDVGTPGEIYNVCSGGAVPIAELFGGLQERLGAPGPSERDPALVRSNEPLEIVGDCSRLRALGWRPRWSRDDLLDDVASVHRARRGGCEVSR